MRETATLEGQSLEGGAEAGAGAKGGGDLWDGLDEQTHVAVSGGDHVTGNNGATLRPLDFPAIASNRGHLKSRKQQNFETIILFLLKIRGCGLKVCCWRNYICVIGLRGI